MAAIFISKEESIILSKYFTLIIDEDCIYDDKTRIQNYSKLGTIEINSLDELMDFIKDVGRIVIDENEIIIYNGYLE